MNALKFLNRFNLSLGRWFGVPVFIHWSWICLFLLILTYNWIAAASYTGLFFIVLLHECGHCLAGKYFGCFVQDIMLYPFGGAATMHIPSKPKEEFVIALAGPAVNVLLIPVFWFIADVHAILHTLALYNIVLLAFNMLPVFPMDGGRVFRAVLAWYTENRLKATTIAVRVGQGFCLIFVTIGLLMAYPMLFIVGVLIGSSAEDELQRVRAESYVAHHDAVTESARIIQETQQRIAQISRNK